MAAGSHVGKKRKKLNSFNKAKCWLLFTIKACLVYFVENTHAPRVLGWSNVGLNLEQCREREDSRDCGMSDRQRRTAVHQPSKLRSSLCGQQVVPLYGRIQSNGPIVGRLYDSWGLWGVSHLLYRVTLPLANWTAGSTNCWEWSGAEISNFPALYFGTKSQSICLGSQQHHPWHFILVAHKSKPCGNIETGKALYGFSPIVLICVKCCVVPRYQG